MATLYTNADSNIRKTWLYLTVFLLLIIGFGWLISSALRSPAILWFAVGLSFLLNFFSYWYSDKLVLAMAGARPIEKRDNPELYRLVENLCITAGLPLPRIYLIDDASPNAFATGRNPKNAVVAVTAGLLKKLDRTELEGVLSHELSHIGNRDILLQTIIVVLVGLVVIISDFFLRASFQRSFSRRNSNERSRGGDIIMLLAIIFSLLAPLLATLIRLAISRKREFLADASGALLTRYPEGLAAALEKIRQDPLSVRRATNATAHLYITSPFKGRQSQNFLVKLFSTHPAVEERIKALREMSI